MIGAVGYIVFPYQDMHRLNPREADMTGFNLLLDPGLGVHGHGG